jgi:hypothetical protein
MIPSLCACTIGRLFGIMGRCGMLVTRPWCMISGLMALGGWEVDVDVDGVDFWMFLIGGG